MKTITPFRITRKGPWAASRIRFSRLRPLNLAALPAHVMVCSLRYRPYLSRLARTHGLTYTTLRISADQMLVLRYKFAPE